MLMRFDPWRLDRLTEQLWSGTRPAMPMDAYRQGDEFVLSFDLPGIDPNTLEVTVERSVLTVKAERRNELGEGVEVLVSERPQGSFVRRVFLGEALDVDNLEARYEQGVLTVVIPVAESAKPRKIEISAAEGAQALEAQTESEAA
jgi:HSP20 family protein